MPGERRGAGKWMRERTARCKNDRRQCPARPGLHKSEKPPPIPVKVQRRSRWAWAEASVWTDRIVAALEYGVQGGVWFSLMDKVYHRKNLWACWCKAAENHGAPGVDEITVERYERDVEANVDRLVGKLRDGTYRPQAIRRTYIPQGGWHEASVRDTDG